jgi:membrane protease YdiL (CAAX protease family)
VATAQLPAEPPVRLFDDNFLRFLPAPLREPRRAWLAIPLAWLLSFAGSVALALIVSRIAPNARQVEIPPMPAWAIILGFAIVSPIIESILMGLGLKLLLSRMPAGPAILVSALFWGVVHSLQVPVWGLAIWWPFLIFSTLFVVWRQRGFWIGVWVAAAAHFLQNLGPSLAIAYPNLLPSIG